MALASVNYFYRAAEFDEPENAHGQGVTKSERFPFLVGTSHRAQDDEVYNDRHHRSGCPLPHLKSYPFQWIARFASLGGDYNLWW